MQDSSDNRQQEKSESQIHYEELRKYFESLVRITLIALGIIIAAGAYFFFSNVGDLRRDITEKVVTIRDDAKSSIENTSALAKQSIEGIKNEASVLAKNEARNRVDEEFKYSNITSLIDAAATREVGEAIQKRIADEVYRLTPKIQTEMSEIGKIADMASRMRKGFRNGMTDLLKIQNTTSSENIKQLASDLFIRISSDYDSVSTKIASEWFGDKISNAMSFLEIPDKANDSLVIAKLVDKIENSNDLNLVSISFIFLRKSVKVPFPMFDIKAVQNWKKEHLISSKKIMP